MGNCCGRGAKDDEDWSVEHGDPGQEPTTDDPGQERPLTNEERAKDFVDLVASVGWWTEGMNAVNADSMVVQVKRLLDKQEEFRLAGKPVIIDLAYHYTQQPNMAAIKIHGLLSAPEREAKGISASFNGASLGNGIYVCDNPFDFKGRGSVGLLVARLQGRTDCYDGVQVYRPDTVHVIAGKTQQVLKTSAQCTLLVEFPSSMLGAAHTLDHEGNSRLHKAHCSIQSLADECFNGGEAVCVPWNFAHSVNYTAPETLDGFEAHCATDKSTVRADECTVCLESLKGSEKSLSRLRLCGHEFHTECIESSLEFAAKCPICRSTFGDLTRGSMPSGLMSVSYYNDITCSGHERGTILLCYVIPSGTQKTYHENPGERHGSADRTAYLPDNDKGRDLLKRLKWAFAHGLTFTVGTSLTTEKRNQVTWSSIHHKTSVSGGVHGFPDPSYFYNVNEALDALNVPAASDL